MLCCEACLVVSWGKSYYLVATKIDIHDPSVLLITCLLAWCYIMPILIFHGLKFWGVVRIMACQRNLFVVHLGPEKLVKAKDLLGFFRCQLPICLHCRLLIGLNNDFATTWLYEWLDRHSHFFLKFFIFGMFASLCCIERWLRWILVKVVLGRWVELVFKNIARVDLCSHHRLASGLAQFDIFI